jgi:hypothetical protein
MRRAQPRIRGSGCGGSSVVPGRPSHLAILSGSDVSGRDGAGLLALLSNQDCASSSPTRKARSPALMARPVPAFFQGTSCLSSAMGAGTSKLKSVPQTGHISTSSALAAPHTRQSRLSLFISFSFVPVYHRGDLSPIHSPRKASASAWERVAGSLFSHQHYSTSQKTGKACHTRARATTYDTCRGAVIARSAVCDDTCIYDASADAQSPGCNGGDCATLFAMTNAIALDATLFIGSWTVALIHWISGKACI